MTICEAIDEAKCCSAIAAEKFAVNATIGQDTDEDKYTLLRLNAYIRMLQRNVPEYKYKKRVVTDLPTSVSFDSLVKQNSFLTLKLNKRVVCEKIQSPSCLSDAEICHTIEQIKLLCSNCNCNC